MAATSASDLILDGNVVEDYETCSSSPLFREIQVLQISCHVAETGQSPLLLSAVRQIQCKP